MLSILPTYPETTDLTLDLRPFLHPLFLELDTGISEFTFANLYLFRRSHHYTISLLADATLVILGSDNSTPFFMLPFGLPQQPLLDLLFHDHQRMKCASREQAQSLETMGYRTQEDRNNFDYLYRRQDLAELSGRNYHKKRNLIKAFVTTHAYSALPLREEYLDDALRILDAWRTKAEQADDYDAAREALEKMDVLQLCGGIYYVASQPVAYTLGEELAHGASYAIHFEKAVPGYKGLYQFINKSFAAVLPEIYETINREQDLGIPGLRKAKLSYNPTGFVEKFTVVAAETSLTV
jgi:hypothetical protein